MAGGRSRIPPPLCSPGAGCRGPNTDWAWAALRGCVGRVPSPVPRTFRACLYFFTEHCGRATFLRLKKRYIETCTSFFAGRSVPPLSKPRDVAVNPGPILFAVTHQPQAAHVPATSQQKHTRDGFPPPVAIIKTSHISHQDCPLYMYLLPGRRAGEMVPIETHACTSTYSPVNDMQHSGRVYIGGPRGPRTPGVLADTGNVPLPYCV